MSSRSAASPRKREKIDAQVFPLEQLGGIVVKNEEEKWKLKRYMKYEIRDWR